MANNKQQPKKFEYRKGSFVVDGEVRVKTKKQLAEEAKKLEEFRRQRSEQKKEVQKNKKKQAIKQYKSQKHG